MGEEDVDYLSRARAARDADDPRLTYEETDIVCDILNCCLTGKMMGEDTILIPSLPRQLDRMVRARDKLEKSIGRDEG